MILFISSISIGRRTDPGGWYLTNSGDKPGFCCLLVWFCFAFLPPRRLPKKSYFSDQHRKPPRSISIFGTGEKRNRLEGSGNQSTFEGAVTEWTKTLRLRRTAAAGRHTKTRDRRAHHHESSCHRIFSGFLMRQYLLDYIYICYWIVLCGCVVYPSWGTTPRNYQGRAW